MNVYICISNLIYQSFTSGRKSQQKWVKLILKDAIQSVCKQRLCLHFGIQNIEFYSTTIYIFMILEYNKLRRDNNQALQEHKMK
jgi:hypothetical protein